MLLSVVFVGTSVLAAGPTNLSPYYGEYVATTKAIWNSRTTSNSTYINPNAIYAGDENKDFRKKPYTSAQGTVAL